MLSLVNNASASTALLLLNKTQSSLQKTQNELSTGLAVSSAADNSSAWSISETMKSDAGAWGALSNGLTQAKTALDNGTSVVKSALSVMNSIKTQLTAATQTGADTASIGSTLKELGNQLKSIFDSSTYNSVNMFDGTHTGTFDIVTSFVNNKGGAADTFGKISMTLTNLVGTGGSLLTMQATGSGAGTDFTNLSATDVASATVADTMSNAEKAIDSLTSVAATIGATSSRVDQAITFAGQMQTNLTNGAAALVEADMNTVSTRLAALQTQQQLGVQALSIANQSSQLILKLFQ